MAGGRRRVRKDISPFLNALMNAARADKSASKSSTGEHSTISVHSLCDWMRIRNYCDGFFVGTEEKIDNIEDISCEFYAPKLAAAVQAWREVTADPLCETRAVGRRVKSERLRRAVSAPTRTAA